MEVEADDDEADDCERKLFRGRWCIEERIAIESSSSSSYSSSSTAPSPSESESLPARALPPNRSSHIDKDSSSSFESPSSSSSYLRQQSATEMEGH